MQKLSVFFVALALCIVTTSAAHAQPDVIMFRSDNIQRWGAVGGITGYSIASTSCNIGNQTAIWIANNNQHPVIAQDIYRIDADGWLEHIGTGWLKHSFCAVSEPGCGNCQGTPCSTLGIGCADTYGTGLNGDQGNLGPRWQVNPSTGVFPYPFSQQGQQGNAIFKRVQCATSDVTNTLNPDAQYFSAVQYVTTDEPTFNVHYNNIGWRKFNLFSGQNFSPSGPTMPQQHPIDAWNNLQGGVLIQEVFTPETAGGGQIVVGSRVEQLPGGLYRYQYAVFNNNSHNSVASLSLPVPAISAPSDFAFRDVNYHSGEPYSGADWTQMYDGETLSWETVPFTTNQNANAIRWGTTYSFAFTSVAPPVMDTGSAGMFRNAAQSVDFSVWVPAEDFTLPVGDIVCFYSDDAAQLNWTNTESYDMIEITRDGNLIATIAGSATSYADATSPTGVHTFGISGISGGTASAELTCDVDIPPPPPLGFDLTAPTMDAFYDATTGEGSFNAPLGVVEDAGNPGFPNVIYGFSMSLGNDGAMVTPTAATESTTLAGLNGGAGPDFLAPAFYADAFTVGCVFNFSAMETLDVSSEVELLQVSYETVAGNLAGNGTGASTNLIWEDGLGDVPVQNNVVVDVGTGVPAGFQAGTISLLPSTETLFLRGDDNGDGSIGLPDPIYSLAFQFQMGPSVCVKAMDFNDNGSVGLDDAILNLDYQFQSGPPPAAPFPGCGFDSTSDTLDCEGPVACP